MKPGIYEDIPFSEYIAIDAVNNSSLGPALVSSLHYHHRKPIGPTRSLTLGRLMHAGKLEPRELMNRYVVMPRFEIDPENQTDNGKPSKTKTTKWYKAAVAEFTRNETREVVEQVDYDAMVAMCGQLSKSARVREYLDGATVELTAVWIDEETGLKCKARADVLQPIGHGDYRITDLKSTADITTFEKAIANFAYDRQAAFYSDGFEAAGHDIVEFCLIAVENSSPYDVASAPLDPDTIDDGRAIYRKALRVIADYKTSGIVSGIGDPTEWRKPSWAMNQLNDDGALTGFDE